MTNKHFIEFLDSDSVTEETISQERYKQYKIVLSVIKLVMEPGTCGS